MIPPELESLNCNQFFDVVTSVGNELNSRKDRFIKSDVLESALSEISGGDIKWVDQIGYDHLLYRSNKTMEMKTQCGCLFTKKGNTKRRTKKIKLTNTLKKDMDAVLEETADYLLLADTGAESYGLAIIPYKTAVEKAERVPDGFVVQFDTDDLEYIFTPSMYVPGKSIKKMNLKEKFSNAIRKGIREAIQ
tara:strand:+ start:3786 stop:4358 length:573 start_codon:yes stop_codon:yes gene_type:complete